MNFHVFTKTFINNKNLVASTCTLQGGAFAFALRDVVALFCPRISANLVALVIFLTLIAKNSKRRVCRIQLLSLVCDAVYLTRRRGERRGGLLLLCYSVGKLGHSVTRSGRAQLYSLRPLVRSNVELAL